MTDIEQRGGSPRRTAAPAGRSPSAPIRTGTLHRPDQSQARPRRRPRLRRGTCWLAVSDDGQWWQAGATRPPATISTFPGSAAVLEGLPE
jgi:hypothetical protein